MVGAAGGAGSPRRRAIRWWRESPASFGPVAHRHARLGGEQHAVAAALERLADDLLRDARPSRRRRCRSRLTPASRHMSIWRRGAGRRRSSPTVGEVAAAAEGHRAEGEGGDPQAGAAELAIFHGAGSCHVVPSCPVTRLWTIGYERLLPGALVAELQAAGVAARPRRALSPPVAAPGDVEDAAGDPAGRARHRLRAPARPGHAARPARPLPGRQVAEAAEAYRRHLEAHAADELDALAAELRRPRRRPCCAWRPTRPPAIGACWPSAGRRSAVWRRRPLASPPATSRPAARTTCRRSTGMPKRPVASSSAQAVHGAAEGARRVHRALALQLQPRSTAKTTSTRLPRGRADARRRRSPGAAEAGRVEPRLGARVGAVGARGGAQGVRARAPDRGVAQGGGQLAHSAQGQRAHEPVPPSTWSERRGAHAQPAGHPRQGDRLQPLGVRDLRRGLDHALGVQPGAGASARPTPRPAPRPWRPLARRRSCRAPEPARPAPARAGRGRSRPSSRAPAPCARWTPPRWRPGTARSSTRRGRDGRRDRQGGRVADAARRARHRARRRRSGADRRRRRADARHA